MGGGGNGFFNHGGFSDGYTGNMHSNSCRNCERTDVQFVDYVGCRNVCNCARV